MKYKLKSKGVYYTIDKTLEKKGHRYIAATNNKVLEAYTNTSSNLSSESKNDRQIKVCHLLKENISKKPLSI